MALKWFVSNNILSERVLLRLKCKMNWPSECCESEEGRRVCANFLRKNDTQTSDWASGWISKKKRHANLRLSFGLNFQEKTTRTSPTENPSQNSQKNDKRISDRNSRIKILRKTTCKSPTEIFLNPIWCWRLAVTSSVRSISKPDNRSFQLMTIRDS